MSKYEAIVILESDEDIKKIRGSLDFINNFSNDSIHVKNIEVNAISSCPYNKIKNAYNFIFLGEKVQFCDDLTLNRKKAMSARWNRKGDIQCSDLDWWRNYFSHIKKSDFLMGRVAPTNGRRRFKLTIDWVLNEQNMIEIYEGKYHRKEGK